MQYLTKLLIIIITLGSGLSAYAEENPFLEFDFWESATLADVKREIAKGIDVNAHDEYGNTVLMEAASDIQNPDIITALIKAGADAKVKDKDGKTAWDYIQENYDLKDTKAYWQLNDLRYK